MSSRGSVERSPPDSGSPHGAAARRAALVLAVIGLLVGLAYLAWNRPAGAAKAHLSGRPPAAPRSGERLEASPKPTATARLPPEPSVEETGVRPAPATPVVTALVACDGIQCAPGDVCCVTSDQRGRLACAAPSACSSGQRSLTCDDLRDCDSGQICCFDATTNSSLCATSCRTRLNQLCAVDAECVEGACVKGWCARVTRVERPFRRSAPPKEPPPRPF